MIRLGVIQRNIKCYNKYMDEITTLKRRIEELEKKLNDFINPSTIPDSFIDSLIKRGFLRATNKITFYDYDGNPFDLAFINYLNIDSVIAASPAAAYKKVVANTNDTLTSSSHGLTDTTPVYFYSNGTAPAGLTSGVIYYVRDATTDTFKLAATSGGSAINITDVGLGSHFVYAFSISY